jgi:two-component system LytT family response regulator
MTDTPSLRLAIVDAEDLARHVLREFLASMPGIEIVAECANGFEAVKAVADLRPDVLLLDVQMPKLNGFEVIELVGRRRRRVHRPRRVRVRAFSAWSTTC